MDTIAVFLPERFLLNWFDTLLKCDNQTILNILKCECNKAQIISNPEIVSN